MPNEPKKRGRRPDPESKRSKGEDRHTKPRKAFHADAELFAAMDKYIRDQPTPPSEATVLRVALERFLASEGYWPPKRK